MEIIERIIALIENPSSRQLLQTIFYVIGIIIFLFFPKTVKAVKAYIQQIINEINQLKDDVAQLRAEHRGMDTGIEKALANGRSEEYAKHRDQMTDAFKREYDQKKVNDVANAILKEKSKFKWSKILWPIGFLYLIAANFIQ